MIYNVVLVSAVQQSEYTYLYVYTYTYIHSCCFFKEILQIVPELEDESEHGQQ